MRVVILFMVLGGINFGAHVPGARPAPAPVAARDEELRLYLALLAFGAAVLIAEVWTEDVLSGTDALRAATFTAVSTMTTTGFSVADYNTWPALALMTIVGLMFIGGSAGSTSGSVKVVRHVLLGKILRREIDQTLHPEIVRCRCACSGRRRRAHVARRSPSSSSTSGSSSSALVLAVDAARTGLDLSTIDAVSVSASMLSNVGLASGSAGRSASSSPSATSRRS